MNDELLQSNDSATNKEFVTVLCILSRYAHGDRRFVDLEVEGEPNFAGANLDDAIFDGTWMPGGIFSRCSLRRASFRRTNLKCADFREADLRGAAFEASLESAEFAGAQLEGVSFAGSWCYGPINPGDTFPDY